MGKNFDFLPALISFPGSLNCTILGMGSIQMVKLNPVIYAVRVKKIFPPSTLLGSSVWLKN